MKINAFFCAVETFQLILFAGGFLFTFNQREVKSYEDGLGHSLDTSFIQHKNKHYRIKKPKTVL